MVYIAVSLGVFFCCFWIAQLVFVRRHDQWSHRTISSDQRDRDMSVSIIHPIKDLDFQFEENLSSILQQNYEGAVQHIFSFQNTEDAAIEVVQRMQHKYPHMDMVITTNSTIKGLNGKSSNMVHGMRLAKYDLVMFIDSDVRVQPDFIVKMIRPLRQQKVGITTCGQVNIGGKDFWTRFFTFLQNSETDFIWAFLTKLGFDLGATGAAFAMRKELLMHVGGLEAFGGSLLEDLHLGNTLYKLGFKLELGPFIACHVDRLEKEKALNYAKRIAIGMRAHIAYELPAFVIMFCWYWILLLLSIFTGNDMVLKLSIVFMGIRCLHGLCMRLVTRNKILPMDCVMGLFFDLFGTFYLLYSLNKPTVEWRGIKYKVKTGGSIEEH